jgi:hypothetical protein
MAESGKAHERGSIPAPLGPSNSTDGAPAQRALVTLARSADLPASVLASVRPRAPYLAHLIAMAQGAPDTRRRRRADPASAIAAYAAALRLPLSRR